MSRLLDAVYDGPVAVFALSIIIPTLAGVAAVGAVIYQVCRIIHPV